MKNEPKKITIKQTEVKKMTTVKKSNIDDFINSELKKFNKPSSDVTKVDMNKIKTDELIKSNSNKFDLKINMSKIKTVEKTTSLNNIIESTKNAPFVINKGLNEEVEKNLLKKHIIEDLNQKSVNFF
jgi:hypothetical protein